MKNKNRIQELQSKLEEYRLRHLEECAPLKQELTRLLAGPEPRQPDQIGE